MIDQLSKELSQRVVSHVINVGGRPIPVVAYNDNLVRVYEKNLIISDYDQPISREQPDFKSKLELWQGYWELNENTGDIPEAYVDDIISYCRDFKDLNEKYYLTFVENNFDNREHFPEIMFNTETFIGVKWYQRKDGWEECQISDLILDPLNKEIYIKTKLYTEILLSLPLLLKNDRLDTESDGDTWDRLIKTAARLHDQGLTGHRRNHLPLKSNEIASIFCDSIIVKKQNGEIIDWKFICIHNIQVGLTGDFMFDSLQGYTLINPELNST